MQPLDYARKATESFTLPEICIRIREMLDSDNASLDNLADLVALDPSLTSKLLKLANSALFRFPSQVDSLPKALNIIGGEALYNLVMIETASSAFEHFDNEVVDQQQFWLQSVYAGLIAKHLAKMAKVRGSERFFLLGLMHNLGELVVASQKPELAKSCLDFNSQLLPWKRQQQVLGFTYALCSSQVLQLWNLPTQLSMPVSQVHDEHIATQGKEAGVLFCAVRAAQALVRDDIYQVKQLVNPLVLKGLKLSEEELQDAVKFARMEASAILSLLSVAR